MPKTPVSQDLLYDPFFANQQRFLQVQKNANMRQNQIYNKHMSEVASLENQRSDREQAEDKLREERRKLLTQQIIDEEKQMKYELRNNQKQTLLNQMQQHEMAKQ